MTPKVNKELCIGCGSCPAISPAVFNMGADGKAEVIDEERDMRMHDIDVIGGCRGGTRDRTATQASRKQQGLHGLFHLIFLRFQIGKASP